MIDISIFRDKQDNSIRGFTVKGHASAGKKGQDIVCSAISVLAYTAIGSLSNVEDIRKGSLLLDNVSYKSVGTVINTETCCEYKAKEGDLECYLREDISQEDLLSAQIILNTIYIGFKQVEGSYGKFIKVFEKEV